MENVFKWQTWEKFFDELVFAYLILSFSDLFYWIKARFCVILKKCLFKFLVL